MKNILEKLFLKSDYAVAIPSLPKELEKEIRPTQSYARSLDGTYNFILLFVVQKGMVEQEIEKIKTSLLPDGLVWIAYPKNKALGTDLSRDILHELMKEYGLDGVSLISLNDTWSAMRFKVI